MVQIWNVDNTNLDRDVKQQENLFIAGNKTTASKDNWQFLTKLSTSSPYNMLIICGVYPEELRMSKQKSNT